MSTHWPRSVRSAPTGEPPGSAQPRPPFRLTMTPSSFPRSGPLNRPCAVDPWPTDMAAHVPIRTHGDTGTPSGCRCPRVLRVAVSPCAAA